MLFEAPYVYDTKQPIFMLPSKCVSRVWQEIQKTHMCGGGVCGIKSYCVQSVRVCQNWLHTNTLVLIRLTEPDFHNHKNIGWLWCSRILLQHWRFHLQHFPIGNSNHGTSQKRLRKDSFTVLIVSFSVRTSK